MKAPICCKKVMRCYQALYINYGDWQPELTYYFQCMKCGELKQVKEKEQ